MAPPRTPKVNRLADLGLLPFTKLRSITLFIEVADAMSCGHRSLNQVSAELKDRKKKGTLPPYVATSLGSISGLQVALDPICTKVFGGSIELFQKPSHGGAYPGLTEEGERLLVLCKEYVSPVYS